MFSSHSNNLHNNQNFSTFSFSASEIHHVREETAKPHQYPESPYEDVDKAKEAAQVISDWYLENDLPGVQKDPEWWPL